MPPAARKKTPAKATGNGDLDALRAEVAAEPDSADEPYVVAIGDTSVRVKHFLDWPASADDDLQAGRITAWAGKVLAGDDFTTVWANADPTNRQVIAFLTDLEQVTGLPFASRLVSPTR
ncbi:hypothetical protein ABT369_38880 [Dactylosporangium sp. NPDC000244]|uniref:hypothetical protein n=1 Tax=Dactylosporangium sp. NPDC000244 TaxID=3154365 RepID=UPI00332C0E62